MRTAMATRAMSGRGLLRVAMYPPISSFISLRFFHPSSRHSPLRVGIHEVGLGCSLNPPGFELTRQFLLQSLGERVYVHSLVDSVMEELAVIRTNRRIRATIKVGFPHNKELSDDVSEKKMLQKGLLLEFRKDSQKTLLAVVQKPDGKKNWMVHDQNGVICSIKPQQVTYIVPGAEDFDHATISDFIQKAQDLLDPSILECAWAELLENKKSVTAEELAEMIYGSRESLESYCAHLLLSRDNVYFSVVDNRDYCSVYEPRASVQVVELSRRKLAKQSSEKELEEFVHLLMSAKAMLPCSKPSKSSWMVEDKVKRKIQCLEAYALDMLESDEQRKSAGNILKAMGLTKTSSAAINLLIDIGYFPVHVNLDLLKLRIKTDYGDEVLLASENLLMGSDDPDGSNRKDLTSLKVYAIDVDDADELDDALSATRLPDGKIKVWIHVADPACLVAPRSIIDREAIRRGTSIFLPTATYPMFPEKLAMEGMSLQQGKICKTVSVSVTLREDGSIADFAIENSIIRPTYMLTYESATELLHLNLEEEAELRILSEAALHRFQWRRSQGAIDTATIDTRIKVANPDDPEPAITLYVEDQSSPAMRLVSEMMILCGEIIATFGSINNIPLPYRGQPQSNISATAFSHLPEGPARTAAYLKIMRAAEMDYRKPIRHGLLGIPGYVQFTSPIRRYIDLLAHYQVKAFLRGEALPFSAGELEGMTCIVNMHVRVAKKLQNNSLRYWLLEYLRRQPRDRRFCALILRFIKHRTAALLLMEVGIQATVDVSIGKQVGDELRVIIVEAHPRDDILSVKEVIDDTD
ncbi:ribonuclease II, chloroplastic/mitochondrial [Curcuma longa]|uniref:ribonuclease II, chloroplastic/mitochondrial n=1 Tax=Curcuma longa TaxID=136217 RepID=UPI003D9ECBEB